MAANFMASTAPIAKFGAIRTGTPGGFGVLAHARVGFFRPAGRTHDHVNARVEERVHVGLGDAGDRKSRRRPARR